MARNEVNRDYAYNRRLFKRNLHASYQIAENVQFFGLINNLFNNHYATYGTFFDTGTDGQYAGSPVNFVGNPRTVTPAQPIAFYGGVKVTF